MRLPSTGSAPDLSNCGVRIRVLSAEAAAADRLIAVLKKRPGVANPVLADSTPKIVTLSYTGSWSGVGSLEESVAGLGAVLDPVRFIVQATPLKAGVDIKALGEELKGVAGVRRVESCLSSGKVTFWASIPELDLPRLFSLSHRLSFASHGVFEVALTPKEGMELPVDLQATLRALPGVLRAAPASDAGKFYLLAAAGVSPSGALSKQAREQGVEAKIQRR